MNTQQEFQKVKGSILITMIFIHSFSSLNLHELVRNLAEMGYKMMLVPEDFLSDLKNITT
jgi:hypothetical protein